jgi:hypothetical protein
MDDVEVALATYPKLLSLVLMVPHAKVRTISNEKAEDFRKEKKNAKVLLESEVGVYQYESSMIWKNPHADGTVPGRILAALENYPSNLELTLQRPRIAPVRPISATILLEKTTMIPTTQ